MGYRVEMRSQVRQPYVAMRMTVPMAEIGEAVGSAFGRLFASLGPRGAAVVGAPWARYLSVGTEEIELEVAVPVATEVAVGDGLVAGVLPASDVATTIHTGPYDLLPNAYAAVNAWLAMEGWQVSGAMWERYENGPDTEPDPADWRTEVVFPITRS